MSREAKATCIVTGSTGIGAATAARLVSRGWRVLIVSRTAENVEACVSALNADGMVAHGFSVDLTETGAAERVLADCLERHGRVDALFNVAGVSGRRFGDGPAHLCTDAGWQQTIDANLTSQFSMCRAVIRHWLDGDKLGPGLRGAILNMSSVLGMDPAPSHFDTIAYGVSKSAIIGMSRIMAARYLRDRISVNVIAPGLVETPMSARASSDADVLAFVAERQPLTEGMVGLDDVAELAAFMIDQGARTMSGQVVHPDGGWQVA